jgi:hypothetical protein
MRAPYSPIQCLTQLSHEQLKSPHRILGHVIFALFALHAILYANFFVQSGSLMKRIQNADVIFGTASIAMLSAISIAALDVLRKRNYRMFYLSHAVIANLIVIPLYFHAHRLRPFVWEVIVVLVLHSLFRAQQVRMCQGILEIIPRTNLVRVHVRVETLDSTLSWKPGQHVYLRRPLDRQHLALVYTRFLLWSQTNPFTVASIPAKDKELLLVARVRHGNTKKMSELAVCLPRPDQIESPGIPLVLEGPYGAAYLPDLSAFNKVLLVAGGVGATFILPIYRTTIESSNSNSTDGTRVRFVWAVQKLAEAQWAFPILENENPSTNPASYNSTAVEVFVTRSSRSIVYADCPREDIELSGADRPPSTNNQENNSRKGIVVKFQRPDIATIVDETTSKATSIAVVSCGPKTLTEQLRQSLHQWVRRGHEVYWHHEGFGQ